MTLSDALAFAATMFVLAASPGPGVFTTVARALACGTAHGAVVASGIVCGDLVYLLLAVYGLAALAQALGDWFVLVQYAGGAYLIWLGIRSWISPDAQVAPRSAAGPSWGTSYLSGLLVTLGNPKAILFYLGLLPAFVNLNSLTRTGILTLALIITCVLGPVMLAYAIAAGWARRLFSTSRAGVIMNAAASIMMLAAGVVVVVKAALS